ncbi:MAG: glycosyl transferase, family 39 [Actinomycetia bacterium]|nr:glycosyl transferase, family 39 [Actinomycetes bacterium]
MSRTDAELSAPPDRDLSSVATRPDGPLREYAAPIVLAAVMLAMGLFRLGSKTVWQDEAFTWSSATLSNGTFVANIAHHEASLGLFLSLQRVWMWFGTGAFWIRLPSVIFATAVIPVLWIVARRLSDARTATIAAALFVVNAAWLSHVQEDRVYPLVVLLACCSTYWFVREVDAPGRRNRWWWVVTSVLMVLAHVLSALVLVAQILSLLVARPDRQRTRHVLGGVGMMAWVVVPFGLVVAVQPVFKLADDSSPSLHFFTTTIRDLVGRGTPLLGLEALAAGAALYALYRIFRAHGRSDDAWRIALPALWFGFSVAAFFAYSQIAPVFQERYMLAFLPGAVILVAMGIGLIPTRPLQALAVVVLLAFAGRGVWSWYDGEPRQSWGSVARMLERDARPNDAIVFEADLSRLPLAYQLRDEPATQRKLSPTWPGGRPWTAGFTSDDYRFATISPASITRAAAGHDRVWVVDVGVHDRDTRAAIRSLERRYRRVRDVRFDDLTRLALYERR